MVGDREQVLAAGCVGYIEKPINPATFVTKSNNTAGAKPKGTQEVAMTRLLIADDNPQSLYLLQVLSPPMA